MKTFFAMMLCSALAFGGEPADAPLLDGPVTLSPLEAHTEAVRVLTCEKDLKDCTAEGKIEPKWLLIGVVSGVIAGVAIGLAAGFVAGKKAQ